MKNMKSKLIVSLGILFIYLNANAQSEYNYLTNKYTVASPDVYNFEKFSLNPINYYVGKAVISVPIYTIKTGGIEYSLTLGYDTGGIKVDQLASNVGLGWNCRQHVGVMLFRHLFVTYFWPDGPLSVTENHVA